MASVAEAEAERSSIIEWRMAGAVEVDIERTVREAGPLAEGVGSVDELSKLSNWVPSIIALHRAELGFLHVCCGSANPPNKELRAA